MRTLPGSWNNLHLGDSTPIWLIRIIPNDSDTWQTIRLATEDVFIQEDEISVEYQDKILKLGSISQSFDPLKGGGLAHVGTFSFTVEKDILPDGIIYNRTIEVFLTFREVAEALEEADLLLLFRGKIKKIKTRQNKAYITAYDEDHDLFKKNIGYLVTQEDYPEMSASYVNIPVVFGKEWVPLKIVKTTDDYWWGIAWKDPKAAGFSCIGFKHALGLARIVVGTAIDGTLIKVTKENALIIVRVDPVYPDNSADLQSAAGNFTEVVKAIDKRADTHAQATISDYNTTIGKAYTLFLSGDYDKDETVYLVPLIRATGSGPNATLIEVKWGKNGNWVESTTETVQYLDVGNWECPEEDAYLQFSSTQYTLKDVHESSIYVGLWTGDNSNSGQLNIFNLSLGLKYESAKVPGELMARVKGRKYGDWARAPYSSEDMISVASHIIESILRDDLGISNIDTESFDSITLGGEGSAYGKAEEILDHILSEYGLVLVKSGKNYMLKKIDNSGTAVITTSINAALQVKDKVLYPPLAQRVILKYYWDGFYEDFLAVKKLSSANDYNVVREEVIESKWIKDDTTADDVLSRKASWLGMPHWLLGLVYPLSLIAVEIGDIVNVDEFKGVVTSLKIDLESNKIDVELFEIST